MRHLCVVVFVALLGPLAAAAPVPKHLMKERPAYYYPTTVGARWDYDQRKLVVNKVEDADGVKVVTVVSENGGAVDDVMEVSETGLRRLGFAGPRFDVPLPLLQGPIRVGTTWEIKTKGAEGTGSIAALESIEVPAGKFEAVRVEIAQAFGGRPRTLKAWYARGVGLLKMTDGDRVIWLLKSFTPGKE